MEILNIIMDNRPKAFLSKKNPLNINLRMAESFSYAYLMPQYWFSWVLIFFSFILIYLPKKIRLNIGSLLGIFIRVSNSKRSSIVMTNLSLCFKSMSNKERKIIHDNYFKNLGKTIIDIPSLWWKSDKSLQKTCEIINGKYIDNELSKGRGVILLTPHTVSLDFGGRSISRYPIISIYKPFRNKLLNWFIGKSRSKKTDNVVVYPRENFSFKKIIKALKSPVIFYYIADEDLGTQNSEFADFFNEKKSTLVSIRKVSKLSNACVIPCINLYCGVSNKYFTYVDEPLEFSSVDDPKKDALIINQALEKLISRDLSQYMWSLRLFQTRPNGQSYPYSK